MVIPPVMKVPTKISMPVDSLYVGHRVKEKPIKDKNREHIENCPRSLMPPPELHVEHHQVAGKAQGSQVFDSGDILDMIGFSFDDLLGVELAFQQEEVKTVRR